jgi:hypothetical protein
MQWSPDIRAHIASMLQSPPRIAKNFRLRKKLEMAPSVGISILQRTDHLIGALVCASPVCES